MDFGLDDLMNDTILGIPVSKLQPLIDELKEEIRIKRNKKSFKSYVKKNKI